jgi:hypothetical protein
MVEDLYESLKQATVDGVVTLPCGCVVEPDGSCPCGNESPLLAAGLV